MHQDDLPITGPCPVRQDLGTPDEWREWFCPRCQTPTHNLSDMTEPQARAFIARRRGQTGCVSYRTDAAGNIVFRRPAPAGSASRWRWLEHRGMRVLLMAALAMPLTAGCDAPSATSHHAARPIDVNGSHAALRHPERKTPERDTEHTDPAQPDAFDKIESAFDRFFEDVGLREKNPKFEKANEAVMTGEVTF